MSRLIKHLIPLCGTLCVALLPRLAAAQECGADAPCDEGFECITGIADYACPGIACAEGQECMQPECPAPEPYSYCSPKACDPDGAADQCGANMVCYSYESGVCTNSAGAPACPPDQDCPDIAPVEPVEMCTTTVESYCAYKYTLPCTEAADCGAGFDCVPQEYTSCSGGMAAPGTEPSMGGGSDPGAGAPAPADGDAPAEADPAIAPPDCTTEVTEEKYCQVIDVTCEADTDCEEGWSCIDPYAGMGGCTMTTPDDSASAPSTEPGMAPAPAMDGGAAPAEGEARIAPSCDPATMVEPVKKCVPPGYYYSVAADGSATAGGESGMAVDSPNTGTVGGEPPRDANGAPVPAAPGGGMTSGSGNNTGTGTNANGVNEANSGSAKGCSMGSTPVSGSTGFAGLLLGLAAFALRRKRTAA